MNEEDIIKLIEKKINEIWEKSIKFDEVLNEVITIDFFSPIPGWAVRQLEVNGKKCEPNQCLFSYSINKVNIEKIEEFLKSNLWMQRINKKIV